MAVFAAATGLLLIAALPTSVDAQTEGLESIEPVAESAPSVDRPVEGQSNLPLAAPTTFPSDFQTLPSPTQEFPATDPQSVLPVPPVSLAEPIRPFTDETQYFRIKDITFVDGDRDNRVDGIGLVTGLSATGGRAAQTRIMAQNFLLRKGVSVQTPETRSMSAVLVNGAIPPYGRQGEKFQVSVSVMDDATSLRGGTLTRTPLRGLDGQIYAFAEGQVLGGGVAAGGQAANVQRDHPTVGVCTAIIEREICADQMTCQNALRLVLRNKDYSTAVSIANALNDIFPGSSRAVDSGAVALVVPYVYHGKLPELIATIGSLAVRVDPPARVVINQKTGTIIMGQHVRLSPVVFAKGSLVIATAESPVASQPLPFSKGETVVLPRSDVDVRETGGPYSSLGGGATVGELGRALNELGFTPNMMIEMFSSLQRIGALQAELIIE